MRRVVRKEYRSHVGVILAILEVLTSQDWVGITKIVRDANLAYKRAKTYLKQLEKERYIEKREEGGRKLYKLTKKGGHLLKKLKDMEALFETFGFPL